MNSASLENFLWAASFVGHAALLIVLLVRRRWRGTPVFTAAICYQLLESALLFVLSRHAAAHTYYVAYWTLAVGDYGLQVALIFELARIVLRPVGMWVRDARRGFLAWSAAGTLLAAGLAMTVAPPAMKGVDLWDARALVFTSLLTCELFLAMSASANRLGLAWRSHVMAIGQGLTVWAAIALLGDLGHVVLGPGKSFVMLDDLREFAYLGVLAFWTVSLWLPEKARAPLSPDMQEYLVALHRKVQYDLERTHTADKPLL